MLPFRLEFMKRWPPLSNDGSSFLEVDGEERQALEDAERGLRALNAERG
jgi:hypothetical protein